MPETTLTLKLDSLKKINEVREALHAGVRKGMWTKAEAAKGLANMVRAEAALRERIESN